MARADTFTNKAAVRILRDFLRPYWPWALACLIANLAAALFEGSTLALLILALQALGRPGELALPPLLGPAGQGLSQLFQRWGPELFFLATVMAAVTAQILKSGLQFGATAFIAFMESRVQAAAYSRLFSHILRLPFARVSRYRLGDLTDYLNQSNQLCNLLVYANQLLRNGLMVLAYGILLLWISWPMTLAALVIYGIVSRILRGIIGRVSRHAQRLMNATVLLTQRSTEFLQAIRLIHTFAWQPEAARQVEESVREGIEGRRKARVWTVAVEPIMDVLTVLGVAGFLIAGHRWIGGGEGSNLPALMALLLALYRITPRLGAIHSSWAGWVGCLPAVGRITELLREKEEEPSAQQTLQPFLGLRERIEFQDLDLQYRPEEPPALKGLSFSILRGSFTALVGASGSGKSSVVNLLLCLYRPTAGSILVDGVDLRMIDPTSWRQRLGIVDQETFLFHASIRENIAFGQSNASAEEIEAAARAAHAHGFVQQLAQGVDTVVGDRGYRLSGGQRQRIALARALLRKPEILILDEATNALDSESERLIQSVLEEQRRHRTILVIAHRLSTIVHADRILVLDQGAAAESGTHEELLGRGGIYARLWRLQSESPPVAATVAVEGSLS